MTERGYAEAKKRLLEGKTRRPGLLIVHTGQGKGKSTAAMGMILRCVGHGLAAAVVQFGKGSRVSGERAALQRFSDLVSVRVVDLGGFSWERDDAGAAEAIRDGWEAAKAFLADPRYAMVVLDELSFVLGKGFLPLAEVLAVLAARREGLHVVATGRRAPPELIALADLATEMKALKHPFRDGVAPQEGVEF